MKAKSGETPKSTPSKRTPPAKKEPTTKSESTPKATETNPASATTVTPASKNTAKKSTPKSTQSAKNKEEASTESKPAAKKVVRKAKSPAAAKSKGNDSSLKKEEETAAMEGEETTTVKDEETTATMVEEETVMTKEEKTVTVKEAETVATKEEEIEDAKEPENDANNAQEDPEVEAKAKGGAGADEEMEEYGEQEKFEEPGDEECMEDDVSEADGEEDEGEDMEKEQQIQISNVMKERKQKKQQEIFVGGLDRDADDDDVKKAFEKVGDVIEVRLLRNPLTNKNKGFAFVKFARKEQADRALSELKSPVIRGKQCGTAPSEDNDTLFLGNICNTWTKEAIRQKLKDYGIDTVENITLVSDPKNEGLSRGFAFLEFPCHEDAMAGYKRLQKPDVIFGHSERTAKVAFAEPLRDPDPEIMAQVKSVFVDGLPPYWDEDHVREQFKGFGEIERVVLARNMATARRKDFGFVDFKTHEAAVACIEGINNNELDDGKMKTKARARLANPLPKTQAVKGGMRGGFRIRHSGRGFVRGGYTSNREGFFRGRGFHPRGRGRTGRFSFPEDAGLESSHPQFRGKRPFGGRGGGRGALSRYDLDRPMHPALGRGRGKPFEPRKLPFPPEEDFSRPLGGGHIVDDPYLYDGHGHGVKRPFSMMDHESGYFDTGSRSHPRYDYSDLVSRDARYQDTLGTGSGLYSHDYYGPDYGGSSYSSLYGTQHSIGRGYYY